jgi:hypothetical protein
MYKVKKAGYVGVNSRKASLGHLNSFTDPIALREAKIAINAAGDNDSYMSSDDNRGQIVFG